MPSVGVREVDCTDPLEERISLADSPIHGLGCFARVTIARGEHIGTFVGREVCEDGPHVLWLCEPDGQVISAREGANLLRWLNHSDRPNAELDAFELYASREIAPGEEITIDYAAGGVA